MTSRARLILLATAALLVAGLTYYVFTAPYARFPGVRIGGEITAAPANWNTVNDHGVVSLKLGGFPPFAIKIFYSTDDDGIITATRPDNGYWAARVRANPQGMIRLGDATYELTATEITGDARIAYLESYGAKNRMSMGYDFQEDIVVGANEPLHTWEVFYWTPR